MRALFGGMSLLLVLAVVALLARSQWSVLKPEASVVPVVPVAAAASATPLPGARDAPAQVLRDLQAAEQAGAARNDAAESALK